MSHEHIQIDVRTPETYIAGDRGKENLPALILATGGRRLLLGLARINRAILYKMSLQNNVGIGALGNGGG